MNNQAHTLRVPTQHQINRLAAEWREITGENGEIKFVNQTLEFIGSELATLRLLKYYHQSNGDQIMQFYSKNIGQFCFMKHMDCFHSVDPITPQG